MSLILEYLGEFGFALHPVNQPPVLINPTRLPEMGTAKPTHILLTHQFEGLDKALEIAKELQCPVVVGEVLSIWIHEKAPELSTITLCIGEELTTSWATIIQIENGGTYELSGVVQPVEAQSFIISAYGHNILFGGPMPLSNDIKQIGLNYRPNVAILALGDKFIQAEQTGPAVMWLGSDIVLPIAPQGNIDMAEVFATIDIYTPAICRMLNSGDCYALQPTESSGRTAGPEARY